jgi:hypothetical protein
MHETSPVRDANDLVKPEVAPGTFQSQTNKKNRDKRDSRCEPLMFGVTQPWPKGIQRLPIIPAELYGRLSRKNSPGCRLTAGMWCSNWLFVTA